MKSENRNQELFDKYLRDQASHEEIEEVLNVIAKGENDSIFIDALESTHRGIEEKILISGVDKEQVYTQVKQAAGIQEESTKLWQNGYFKYAASLVLVLAASAIFWFGAQDSNQYETISYATARGQRMTVTLPDQSVVQLNGESTLSYPEEFAGESRLVSLSGEAFFEVTKNPNKPFIVQAGEIQTLVLGTAFNVKSIKDEQLHSVTLLEGKVQVSKSDDLLPAQKMVLAPGQRAVWNGETNQLSKNEEDIFPYLAWKDGILHFRKEPLAQAFQKISQWYGVDIEIDPEIINSDFQLEGEFKDESLETVLQSVSIVYGIEYEFKNQKMIKIRNGTNE